MLLTIKHTQPYFFREMDTKALQASAITLRALIQRRGPKLGMHQSKVTKLHIRARTRTTFPEGMYIS